MISLRRGDRAFEQTGKGHTKGPYHSKQEEASFDPYFSEDKAKYVVCFVGVDCWVTLSNKCN